MEIPVRPMYISVGADMGGLLPSSSSRSRS